MCRGPFLLLCSVLAVNRLGAIGCCSTWSCHETGGLSHRTCTGEPYLNELSARAQLSDIILFGSINRISRRSWFSLPVCHRLSTHAATRPASASSALLRGTTNAHAACFDGAPGARARSVRGTRTAGVKLAPAQVCAAAATPLAREAAARRRPLPRSSLVTYCTGRVR